MWKLNSQVLSDKPLTVALVGVGGTGSELCTKLVRIHRLLQAMGYGGVQLVAFDPDVVSEANVVRQHYSPADIGLKKASVLIHRINLSCGLDWRAVPERFKAVYACQSWDVVISCVDTRKARAEMHKWAFGKGLYTWRFWLDCGNDDTTGQVILGTPRSQGRVHPLPCATELHPELMDTSIPDDTKASCSAIEAVQRQDLFVNSMVATLAADLLWRLLRDKGLKDHRRYFSLEHGTLAGGSVPEQKPRSRAAASSPKLRSKSRRR